MFHVTLPARAVSRLGYKLVKSSSSEGFGILYIMWLYIINIRVTKIQNFEIRSPYLNFERNREVTKNIELKAKL